MSSQDSAKPFKNSPGAWDIVYFPLGSAAFGGAERSLMELATAQQSKGLRVLICYERALENGDFLDQARDRNLPLRRVEWSPEDSFLHVIQSAWQLFRSLDTRLLHFNIAWRRQMWIIPLVARLATGARLVGSMRAMPDRADNIPRQRHFGIIPGLRLWTLPDHFIGRVWARTLHITVSVNRDDFPPRLIREYGYTPTQLRIVYNGVPIPDHVPDQATRNLAKARFGIPDGVFVAAYVGRVAEEKGIRYAIEALKTCNPEVQLLVAGEGDQLEELKKLTAQLGLSQRVHFTGYVSNASLVFSAAEIAVVPSICNEAFGRVVVEAMACGTVVIATSVGGMQELFCDNQEGFFVPTANADAISEAINKLFHDRAQCARMATAGRSLAEARYATQRVAVEYGKIYSELLENQPSPSATATP